MIGFWKARRQDVGPYDNYSTYFFFRLMACAHIQPITWFYSRWVMDEHISNQPFPTEEHQETLNKTKHKTLIWKLYYDSGTFLSSANFEPRSTLETNKMNSVSDFQIHNSLHVMKQDRLLKPYNLQTFLVPEVLLDWNLW